MAQKWFFYTAEKTIVLRARIKSGEAVGDTEQFIGPETQIDVPGLTYNDLVAASPGVLEFADDGSFSITPSSDQG